MAVRSIVAAATVGLPVIGAGLGKGKGGVGIGAVAVGVEAAAYTRHWFVCRYRVALLVLLVGAIGGRGHDGMCWRKCHAGILPLDGPCYYVLILRDLYGWHEA